MRNVPSAAPKSAYVTITEKIVALIEAGAPRFEMPWHVSADIGRPRNAVTHRPYRGINVVALWAEAMAADHGSGLWATYRQWSQVGAQVRRGERGAAIVFYKPTDRSPDAKAEPAGDEAPRRRLVVRVSTVFNAAQVEGAPPPPPDTEVAPLTSVMDVIAGTGAQVEHAGDQAAYDWRRDRILMPRPERFRDTSTSRAGEAYHATLLHELTHWTGAAHRLNRPFGRFGDSTYALEELVAEMGAAFLCADLGVTNEPRADHAAYIGSWLKALSEDVRVLFRAAAAAEAATEYVIGRRATNT